ncbi:MAG TPA: HU family DNA-binding protein [Ignavibacteria bacterium]|nr:HU family DNA-binding protein [Ignavibacteria bacterium]
MKKEDIINKIMDEFDVARIDAAEIVNNIFSILRNSLIKGKHINISEFGKFDVNYKKGESGKILQTVSFSPVKKFSYDVNDSFNNLEPVTVAFITNFKEEDYPDVDMEDYEEVIDEIEEKEFIQSRVSVVEGKLTEKDKAKEETKEKFKEIFREESKEESTEKKIDKLADDRRKSFFDSERYRLAKTEPTEETISDKILSGTIDEIEARNVIEKQEIIETHKEALPDFSFIDREEPEEPLVVELKEPIEDIKEPEATIETETTEIHGYIPSEKEILDFERIREELNNKIKETFGDIVSPEPVAEDEIQEEIQEEVQPALTEDVSEIESKEPEIRTPEESNVLEEDLITQQDTSEEIKDETRIEEPKSEEQSFRDMFEEKEKLFDERDEILKEIESKISEDFAKLDEDDFNDIDSDTIKKIEDINKATEEKLKAQTPDDDIKIPDFDFKNLFKDSVSESGIPEAELPQEEESEEVIEEEIKAEAEKNKQEEDFSFEGSDILIPEEIKQLHEEIQSVKPFEGLEAKKDEQVLFKNGDDEDVKFDFFKDYNDIFEDKEGGHGMKTVHPTPHEQMPYPKRDVTDEQKEGSKIFSLSIMILIGIVIAVFAGIYFLLSSDLFKPKSVPVLVDSVKKEQQVIPAITDSSKQNQQSKDTTNRKDTVKTSSQPQTPPTQNNQTTSTQEDSQYRKLNPGEEEQINDPANNVVYIRTTDGVYIQTGSYKDKAIAEGKANALKKAGVQNVSVVEANLGAKGIYYRVRVGKYPTVQEAKNNSQKVKI